MKPQGSGTVNFFKTLSTSAHTNDMVRNVRCLIRGSTRECRKNASLFSPMSSPTLHSLEVCSISHKCTHRIVMFCFVGGYIISCHCSVKKKNRKNIYKCDVQINGDFRCLHALYSKSNCFTEYYPMH